ncbi:hypothetical protein UFOVP130_43 [uncultured Caudovirales phage]|uniref:Uncharacterized protein n=1 Tax=uncultured Caudovirales phage TaxID=2100421 RepID=A0A6J5LD91_9CAUD|nr:hypothetical protein UFOVP130_43 [uncultured Caudovirales phage]
MAFSFSRNERIYLQVESVFGTIPNSTGTATVAGSNCCRHVKAMLKPDVALLKRPDKTGTRTRPPGVAGRKTGSWSMDLSLAGNGTAGVVPDIDPVLQALFGNAATISAGVSATYSLSDAVKSFVLWSFRTPSTVMQRAAAGCVVKEATFKLGQDIASLSMSGTCQWVPDSIVFSGTDTAGKCGLTTFPAEPGSPVTNGNIIAGFTGVATFDGNVLANIRSATVKIATGNDINRDVFGTFYGDAAEGDARDVTVSFDLFDSDAAGTTNLYTKAISKSGINIVLQIGTVAGNIWTLTIKGVQLAVPSMDDGQRRWVASFGDGGATGSTGTALDEVSLVIT